MEFPFEIEIKPSYDYEPYEAPSRDCPGAPEYAAIYGYRIKTPLRYIDMSDFKLPDGWYAELKKAFEDVALVGASEDQHWQAVGRLSSVIKWYDRLDTLEHVLTPYLEDLKEEWEQDIVSEMHDENRDY